jgi:hypothetical protein
MDKVQKPFSLNFNGSKMFSLTPLITIEQEQCGITSKIGYEEKSRTFGQHGTATVQSETYSAWS